MFILGLLNRLPGTVMVIAMLIGMAWFMQWAAISPDAVALFLNSKVALLMAVAVAVMPYGAFLAGVVTVFYLIAHHHQGAITAGVSAVLLGVIYILWRLGLGIWLTAHLTGQA